MKKTLLLLSFLIFSAGISLADEIPTVSEEVLNNPTEQTEVQYNSNSDILKNSKKDFLQYNNRKNKSNITNFGKKTYNGKTKKQNIYSSKYDKSYKYKRPIPKENIENKPLRIPHYGRPYRPHNHSYMRNAHGRNIHTYNTKRPHQRKY